MMDTQRLIAFVIFSFSALLLWDAWQKHNAPKVIPAPAGTIAPAGVPQASAPLSTGTPTPAAVPGATAAAAPVGQPVRVKTDLLDIELNTTGADIRRLTLLRVFSATDRTKPLVLMEPDAKHYFVTQSGLVGEGLPIHRSPYVPDAPSYELQPGKDFVDVRFRASDAAGAEVVK